MPDPAAGHFVIAGAQRCGTTLLYELLDANDEIEMARPMRPEPKWFLAPESRDRGREDYLRRLFSGHPVRWRGEKSTSYIEHPGVASRIAAILPEARIFVSVRDPIDRAVSNYDFSSDHGVETRPITEALSPDAIGTMSYDSEQFSVSPFAYLERGRYVDHLAPWLDAFGRERLEIVFFDDVCAGLAMSHFAACLGIRTPEPTTAPEPVNASTHRSTLPTALREELTDFYRPSVRGLERLTGRNLDHWLQPSTTEVRARND